MNHKSAIMKEDKAWRFISVFFNFCEFYLLKVYWHRTLHYTFMAL